MIDRRRSAFLLLVCIAVLVWVRAPRRRSGKTLSVPPAVYGDFIPAGTTAQRRNEPLRETTWASPIGACAEWRICNPPRCELTEPPPVHLKYPPRTKRGIPTPDFVQSVMRRAWGERPPSIDLYVRTGCMGAEEMQWLWRSVELFWPRFLGTVIVVLDAGNESAMRALVPEYIRATFSVLVAYEPCPCLQGRIFNQVSYARSAERYSTAEYLVTIDSDCAFHRPVTPDALFNERGELYVVTNRVFQAWEWDESQTFYTGRSNREFGHAMTTQPVSFKTESLREYQRFIEDRFGSCYERRVSLHMRESPHNWFCWMCQIQMYLMAHRPNEEGYAFRVLDAPGPVYLRFAAHVSYEHFDGSDSPHVGNVSERYQSSVNALVNQGLCLWFGEEAFAECADTKGFEYVERLMTTYNTRVLQPFVTREMLSSAIRAVKDRLQDALQ